MPLTLEILTVHVNFVKCINQHTSHDASRLHRWILRTNCSVQMRVVQCCILVKRRLRQCIPAQKTLHDGCSIPHTVWIHDFLQDECWARFWETLLYEDALGAYITELQSVQTKLSATVEGFADRAIHIKVVDLGYNNTWRQRFDACHFRFEAH